MALSNRSLLRAIEEDEDDDLDLEEQAFKLLEQDDPDQEDQELDEPGEESKTDLKEQLLLQLEMADLEEVDEMLLMEMDADKPSSDEIQLEAKVQLKLEGTAPANGISARTGDSGGGPTITDKEFYKAMQKLKDRGTNAVPPKKSASAYILFGKEVSKLRTRFFHQNGFQA